MNAVTYIDGQPWPPPGPDVVPTTRRYRNGVLVSETYAESPSEPARASVWAKRPKASSDAGDRVAPPSRPAMNAGGFPAKPAKPTRPRQSDAAVDSIPGLGPSLTRVYRACERLAVGGVLVKQAVCDETRLKWITVEKYVSELRRLGYFPWRWEGVQRNRRRNGPDPVAMAAAGVAPVTPAAIRDLVAVCDRTNVDGYVRLETLAGVLKIEPGDVARLFVAAKAAGRCAYELTKGGAA